MKPIIKQTKFCPKCKQEKSIEEFSSDKGRKDYLASYCKKCTSATSKIWYNNLPPNGKIKLKIRRAALIDRNRNYVFTYLSEHPCIDCGEARIGTLEFDHVRGIKRMNVSLMINSAMSIDSIENEIKKCDIRCANCHRIKTSDQFGFARSRFQLRKIEKTIKKSPRTASNIMKRFWKKVNKTENDQACWIWNAGTYGKNGPGIFRLNIYLGTVSSHKYAYEITYGEIPKNQLVCHTCTNILCCNPAHLFVGTRKDSAVAREQKHRGELRSNHKLNKDKVREIKQSNLSVSALSRQYNVSRATITNIKTGKTWSYITV
jgi:hypothetical protein